MYLPWLCNMENYTVAATNMNIMLCFWSQGWYAYSSVKLDLWSEELLKLQYSIKVLCNHGKSKGSLVSKIPKSVQCGYDDSFKLMVIKYAKAISDCATAWGLCVAKESTWRLRKQTLLKGANATQKTFCGPKQRKFNVDKNTEGNFISAIASSMSILWWKVSFWQQECWQWLAISVVFL